ncbi:MAG: MerR family transcriptional regulator [Eubacterium sp.]|nr:MerR family transcriptional regulator [Eubacterium sp.]
MTEVNGMDENTDFQLLKIGELAAMAGISVKAMRVYEKKDIIKPVHVDDETGYRYYSAGQLQQLEALLALQDMGVTLNEIALIMSGQCSKEEMSELVEKKKAVLQELIWKTEAKKKALDNINRDFEQWAVNDKTAEMTDEERAKSLAKLAVLNEENVRQILSEVVWL